MQIEDISSLNEREQCYEYTDGLKWAADEDVEVNTLEDQVDGLKELKENMKLFNWNKIKRSFLYVPDVLIFLLLFVLFPHLLNSFLSRTQYCWKDPRCRELSWLNARKQDEKGMFLIWKLKKGGIRDVYKVQIAEQD